MLVTRESSRAALARRLTRLYTRLRTPAAHAVTTVAPTGSIEDLRGRRHCLVVTYRRDGAAVPTPMWFGIDDGTIVCRSAADNAKVRRIRNDPRVLLAPCTTRGRPTGPPFEGHAEIRDTDEAEAAIAANYGAGRRIYKVAVADAVPAVYIRVTPVAGAR
jgi:PPOX class probable F420-dependent enzyme